MEKTPIIDTRFFSLSNIFDKGAILLSIIKRTIHTYLSNYAGLPRICWHGITVNGLVSTVGGIGFYISIYLINSLKMSVTSAGILVSCYGIGTIGGGFVGGKLSDRFSPGLIAMFSALLMSISYILIIKIHSYSALITIMFIMGLTYYAFVTANSVMVLNYCVTNERERLRAINILYVVSNIGLGLAALIIGLTSFLGFNFIFIISSLILILAFLYQWLLEEIVSEKKQKNKAKIDHENSHAQRNFKPLILVLGCLFAVGLIVAQTRITYPLYLHQTFPTLGMKAVSFLLALNPIIIIICQTPLNNYLSNCNKILMVGIGAALMGFGMWTLIFSIYYSLAIIACLIYTFGEMIFFVMVQLVCYENATQKQKGRNLGLFKTVYAMSVVVGPTLGGVLYKFISMNAVWYFCGIMGALSLGYCLKFRRLDRVNE